MKIGDINTNNIEIINLVFKLTYILASFATKSALISSLFFNILQLQDIYTNFTLHLISMFGFNISNIEL